MFKMVGYEENEEIHFLKFDSFSEVELHEMAYDHLEAEWMFLTETLRWKEGL